MSIHYALRDEVDKDSFLGGVLAAGDTDIDVLDALQKGGGLIEIADDDHVKAAVLDGYTPLQRVAAPVTFDEVKTAPATDTPRGEGVSAPADGVLRDVPVGEPDASPAPPASGSTAPSRSADRTNKKES